MKNEELCKGFLNGAFVMSVLVGAVGLLTIIWFDYDLGTKVFLSGIITAATAMILYLPFYEGLDGDLDD